LIGMMVMKSKDEKKNPVIIPASYKIDSTLEELDALALAIPQAQEIEQKVEAINEIESLAEINKQKLAVRREKVSIELDNRKLDVAKTILEGIEIIADEIVKPETIQKIMNKPDLTAMDLKFLAESMDRMATVLNNMMKPNVADEFGNKKRHKINFMFKSNGPVQAAIQVDTSND
jgi:hypothetical protein